MDNNKGMIGMALGSWLVAFAGGTLAGTLLWVLGGWSFLQGAFVGMLVFVVSGAVVSWIMTRPLPAPNEAVLTTPPTPGEGKTAPTPSSVTPSKRLPGEEELASRKGSWKYEKEGETEAKETASSGAGASEDRPALMMDAPRDGKADNLKKISGVGPKLEQTLNELGIWHFDQVAKFKKKDIAWVDERLRFKGRIERDDWIGQAKALMKDKG